MMKRGLFLCVILVEYLNCISLAATVRTPIVPQTGQDIICNGPTFTYQHDVRQHGVDANLAISGDAAIVVESDSPYASFYTDSTKGGNSAVYQYSFVTEDGSVFGDVSVASRVDIYENGHSVIGEYQIGDGDWIQFMSEALICHIRPIHVFENIHDSHFRIRYTVTLIPAQWYDRVQLFRSWGPEPGQPGDFIFTFTASLVTDLNCHQADLRGDIVWIDLADLAVVASDYGLTGSGLAGDIDGNGSCDLGDLAWLASYWQCDCYE